MTVSNREISSELPSLYLTFNWSNEKVWELNIPVEEVPISELDWHLNIPIWSTVPGKRLFDLRPFEVIKNPDKHRWHHDRIKKASIEFPIDTLWHTDRYVILDGVHRLAKLSMLGISPIRVRKIGHELAPLIRSEDYPDD